MCQMTQLDVDGFVLSENDFFDSQAGRQSQITVLSLLIVSMRTTFLRALEMCIHVWVGDNANESYTKKNVANERQE